MGAHGRGDGGSKMVPGKLVTLRDFGLAITILVFVDT